jgi:SAM-dependent methyltransferase
MQGQFGNPSGNLGKIVGWLMSKSNTDLNNWAIEKMGPSPAGEFLEIGYGPGQAIQKLASSLTKGRVTGIDHSELMHRFAMKRNNHHVNNRKAVLLCGDSTKFDFPESGFDLIYGVNVHFFWEDPAKEFGTLYKYLKPTGKLLMVFQPRWVKNFQELERVTRNTVSQFQNAGYAGVEIDYKLMRPVTAISVLGRKKLY